MPNEACACASVQFGVTPSRHSANWRLVYPRRRENRRCRTRLHQETPDAKPDLPHELAAGLTIQPKSIELSEISGYGATRTKFVWTRCLRSAALTGASRTKTWSLIAAAGEAGRPARLETPPARRTAAARGARNLGRRAIIAASQFPPNVWRKSSQFLFSVLHRRPPKFGVGSMLSKKGCVTG